MAAPSTLRDEATARLEMLRARAREGRSIGDDHLIQLAWESFAAGFAAGSAETDAARTEAASPRDRRSVLSPTPPSLADLVDALSPRRLEVLRLVARGLTNREIADVLGISSNTVKAHLAGVLEALDLTNRTEAAAALRDYEEERAGSPD